MGKGIDQANKLTTKARFDRVLNRAFLCLEIMRAKDAFKSRLNRQPLLWYSERLKTRLRRVHGVALAMFIDAFESRLGRAKNRE